MKVRQRILYLRKHEPQDSALQFGRLCNDLQKSIAAALGEERAREALADWPNCAWGDEGGALTVSTWESVRDPDLQLLDMELTLHHGERMWTVQVQVGTERPDEIVVQEVCRHTPDLSQPPIDEMPDVLGFLAEYPSMDEDSRFACRVYSLMPARAGVFAGFVRAPIEKRRLPAVFVTRRYATRQEMLPPAELVKRLGGVAHVVRLNPRYGSSSQNFGLGHPCFDGAVRVYLPGYADDDGPGVHRYWHPNWIDEHGPDATIDAVVRYVLEKSSNREIEDEMIAALVQERDEEAMRSEVQRQVESVRQRMQEQLAGQSGDAELLESFYRDYDELAGKYDQLAAENERLRQQRKELEDDNRSLNYRLSRQWEYEDAPPEPDVPMAEILLSAQAREVYENLDAGERVAVDSKLLARLVHEEIRSHKAEPIEAAGGLCFVYPRGRAAGGRRVVFWMDRAQVRVCEIFANHNTYEDMRNGLRGRGVDLSKYSEFTAWQPEDPSLLRESVFRYSEDEAAAFDESQSA